MAINIVSKESLTKVLKQFKEKIKFSNEDVLKKISVSTDNKLLYDGNPIVIGNGKSLKISVVDTLPTSDISDSTIYLVSNNSSKENNIYTEYIYVNSKWEIIGSIDNNIDLTQYVKKDDLKDYAKTTDLTSYVKSTTYNTYTANNDAAINDMQTSIQNLSNNDSQYITKDTLNDYLNSDSSIIKYPLNMTDTNSPDKFSVSGIQYGTKDIAWQSFSSNSNYTYSITTGSGSGYTLKIQLDKLVTLKKIYVQYCTLGISKIEAFNDSNFSTSNGVIFSERTEAFRTSLTVDLSDNEIKGQSYIITLINISSNSGGSYYYTFGHFDLYIDNEDHLTYLTKEQIVKLINSTSSGSSGTTSTNVDINSYDNSKTYSVNDYVIYNNCLYKCNTEITVAEEFDINKWTLLLNGSDGKATLDIKQVDALPTKDISTDTIYLVPNDSDKEDNSYTEYIYVNSKWEIFGPQQKSNITIGSIEW